MLEYYHYLVLKNNYDTNFYTTIKQRSLRNENSPLIKTFGARYLRNFIVFYFHGANKNNVKKIQNGPITVDCKTVRIFAYSSTREQSNEAENRERDWGETLKKTLRKALLAESFRINVIVKPNIKINTS